MESLTLDGQPLTIADIVDVARGGRTVAVGAQAHAHMEKARLLVEQIADGPTAVYGINTGFGNLSRIRIPTDQLAALQHNLIRSHAAGVGAPLSGEQVRALMLLSAASLARGHSGVRPVVVVQLVAMLNARIHPFIPSRGSVGASGDLAPLAHMALALIGEGRVLEATHDTRHTTNDQQSMRAALAEAGIEPLELAAKEGLALINGTHLMAAVGALLLCDVDTLFDATVRGVALSTEAIRGTNAPLDARIHAVRPQHGQALVAAQLRALTEGSEILVSHADCGRVQDPYSIRCAPQVLGAVADGIGFARELVERELGAVTDNPLCYPDDGAVISGGNFHGQPLALAFDVLGMVLTQLAAFSERRTYLLVAAPDPAMGLPPCLTRNSGVQSGLMIAQYAAAALVNECQTLAMPASVHSIPTGAGMEDFVSMGVTAAHKAVQILEHARRVVAIELLCAAQALEFQRPLRAGHGVEQTHARIRSVVPVLEEDRVISNDIAALEAFVRANGFEASW